MRPIRKSPESTPHQYSAAYEWTDKDGGKHTGYWSQLCSGANQALLHFHNFVQHNQESDAERKVVRPKLRFDQYRIKTLEVVFRGEHRDERGVEFRQAVEIPLGPTRTYASRSSRRLRRPSSSRSWRTCPRARCRPNTRSSEISRNQAMNQAMSPSPSTASLLQPQTEGSSDIPAPARIEQRFCIVSGVDPLSDISNKSHIVVESATYLSPSGKPTKRQTLLHGPYRSRREISALLQGNAAPPPTQAAFPTSTRTDL